MAKEITTTDNLEAAPMDKIPTPEVTQTPTANLEATQTVEAIPTPMDKIPTPTLEVTPIPMVETML
jgi:hypothetical protein